jgi:hypothetical protein
MPIQSSPIIQTASHNASRPSESGVQPPAAKGFGTVLLQGALAPEKTTSNVRFDPHGLVYELEGKRRDVRVLNIPDEGTVL